MRKTTLLPSRPCLGLALVCALALVPRQARAAELTPQEGYTLIANLMSENKDDRRAAADELIAADDVTLVPALVDAYFYTPLLHRPEMTEVLTALTGEEHDSYYDWVEYVGGADIDVKDRYIEWKQLLLRRRDAEYEKVFYAGAPHKIRLEEIVSGGVPLDGIPSLDDVPLVPAKKAKYLKNDELVFGVEIDGDSRAYPHRFLSWHEMLNDVVGGQPVTLSYCTLCGSGILYAAQSPSGERRTFGTSGLLYRSNKLMYDRDTYSLWSNITGEAVVGRAAGENQRLRVLPMTLTTWEEWRSQHPDTTALDIDGVRKASPFAFDYVPGAADEARKGVEFPVWQKSDRLERNAEVFALDLNGAPKAYPVEKVTAAGLVHDELGGVGIVLVANPDSGAIRAYQSGGHTFEKADGDFQLVDETGAEWTVTEAALEPAGDGPSLPRLAHGHIAYWFGWYGFHPQTEVWEG